MGVEDPEQLEQEAAERAAAGDYAAALGLRERAYTAWRQRGDLRRAGYLAAYHIAFDHLALFGSRAVAQGWLERGGHLVDQAGVCAEAGWVALSRALHARDPSRRAELVERALELAARFGDADLHFDALAYQGLAAVEDGRVAEGMRRLDEAAAAARGGEVVNGTVAGEIHCKLLVACESTLDVRRAEQWYPVMTTLGERSDLAWASAICRTHYGGILTAAGRWEEAERELGESLRLYDVSYPALRDAAVVRLAELRARQGRAGEARELLTGQAVAGHAVRPWARAEWLAARDADERAVVAARLARALGEGRRLGDVPTLALLADMQAACGDVPAARSTAQEVAGLVGAERVEAMVGFARQCNACAAVAEGEGDGWDSRVRYAVGELAAAITAFAAAGLPLEEAVARLRLAELVRDGDPGLARAEASQAGETFARLGAGAELDRAAALVRALGGRARTGARRVGSLSDREREVLALVAQGLSNAQIAERLFISTKTASHHVSNVLTKLGVHNRAEAAAWAAAHGMTGTR